MCQGPQKSVWNPKPAIWTQLGGLSGEGASNAIDISHTFTENIFENVAGGQEFPSKLVVNGFEKVWNFDFLRQIRL